MVGNITMLVQKYSGLFLEGMGYTLLLALITVTFGTVLGTLVALAKMGKFKVLSFLATAYIEIMRGTRCCSCICFISWCRRCCPGNRLNLPVYARPSY